MRRLLFGLLFVGTAMIGAATARGDDALEEAIKKDRQMIEGTWRAVELQVNGNASNEADAKKFVVVNGSDGTWSLTLDGKEIARGTSEFDPTKTPKTLDFTITDGDSKGKQFLGIYELGEKTRRMCFAEEGKERPKEFASPPGSGQVLLRFEREAK
jgi:uncharacterized protein (TIGR03067 family)